MENPFEVINKTLQNLTDQIAMLKDEVKQLKGESPISTEIVSTPELRKRLGISEATLWRWRENKRIPFMQVGRAIKYDYQEVLKHLKKRPK